MNKLLRRIAGALLIALLCTCTASSQIIKPSVTLGFNAMYCMPQGDFKKLYKYGAGGEVYGGVGWGKTFVLATVGYRAFKEDATFSSGSLSFIPIKLGVKQLLFMKRLFVQADAGILNAKQEDESSSGFTYDVGAGLRFAGTELGLFYDGFKFKDATNASNTLNVKVGYSFSF